MIDDENEIVQKLLDLVDWTTIEPIHSVRIYSWDEPGKEPRDSTYFLGIGGFPDNKEELVSALFDLNVRCHNIIGFGLGRAYGKTELWIKTLASRKGNSNITWKVVHSAMDLLRIKHTH